jgi:hypothetical protein
MSIGWNGTPAFISDPWGLSLLPARGLTILFAAVAEGAVATALDGEPSAAPALLGSKIGIGLSSPLLAYVLH